MNIEYIAHSQKGIHKTKNEDYILINDKNVNNGTVTGVSGACLAVVCDGVGSVSGSGIAARITAQSFTALDMEKASPARIMNHLHAVNKTVMNEQRKNTALHGMATTVAGIIVDTDRYMVFNMGDTRVYIYNSEGLSQLSVDHTLRNEKCYWGNAGIPEDPSAITSYIGGNGKACYPSVYRGMITNDEGYFMLCSDGIHKALPPSVLSGIIYDKGSLEDKKRTILKEALQNGSVDDMSLVLIRYSAG